MPPLQPQTSPAPQTPLVVMSPAVAPPSEEQSHFHLPKLRLEVRDLSHKGASIFLSTTNAVDVLRKATRSVLKLLYHAPHDPSTTVPPTRSVTLILRDMPGVAYTTGTELDNDHKEIHFSLQYIASIRPENRQAEEIEGVLTHELVHCFQHNGRGSCPGGLIEGVADWVRLRCDLGPPHWKRDGGDKWDAGYQHTGYFLDYLEHRFGAGTVRRLNEKLRAARYEEKAFWTELVGRPVKDLWDDYVKTWQDCEKS